MIGGYTALLARRYSGTLGVDGDEFISFITTGVDRMQRLIRNVLTLCRLTEASEAPIPDVSVAHIVDLVCGNLELLIEDTGGVIRGRSCYAAEPVRCAGPTCNCASTARIARSAPPVAAPAGIASRIATIKVCLGRAFPVIRLYWREVLKCPTCGFTGTFHHVGLSDVASDCRGRWRSL